MNSSVEAREGRFRQSYRAGSVVVFIIAIVYYILYIDKGFNIYDDGNYAQVAYELFSGRDPHDLRYGYGLIWYELGRWLFGLVGPRFITVQAIFFVVMAVTAALVYATVVRIAGNRLLALFAGLLAALVPNFAATAFYGFCTLINLFTQVGMALRWRTLGARDVIAATAALTISFLLRPDFGYAFAVPFLLLLVMSGVGQGWRVFARLLGTVAAVAALILLPVVGLAVRGGSLDLMIADLLRFPATMLNLVLAAARGPAGAAADGAGTLLQRPPFSALWEGPWPLWGWAFGVYVPLLGLAAFALVQIGALVRDIRTPGRRPLDRAVLAAVLLAGALVSLPHYLLFRPDLSHVANFMPGYIVVAAVLIWELRGGDLVTAKRGRATIPGTIAAGALVASLVVYGVVGLTLPGSTSIVRARGENQPFRLTTGETLYVSPSTKVLLDRLRELIETHSAPGERIVCLPWCPGVAFMTGRRMLLRDFYADDSFLVTDPGWLARTIAQTEKARTPVVVIFDGAVNGTDISRFPVWGKPYMDFLEKSGYRVVTIGPATVYLRPEDAGSDGSARP